MESLLRGGIIQRRRRRHDMSQKDEHLDPDPLIEAYLRDVDRTLLRENLRLSVEDRFEKLMRLQQFAEELRRAARTRETRR